VAINTGFEGAGLRPHKKNSVKWTALPAEFLEQIEAVFNEGFKNQLADYQVRVQGRIYPEELLLRLTCSRPGELKQHNFTLSRHYLVNKDNALEQIHQAVDALGELLATFLADESMTTDWPRDWQEISEQAKATYFVYSTENRDLEEQANQLLGDDLIQGTDDSLLQTEPAADEADPLSSLDLSSHRHQKSEIH
jgi:hypothetical protein